MPITKKSRHFLQITMQPDLYNQVKEHCKALDKPVTVWVRDLIVAELEGK
jgi:hypothetical protein